MTTPAPAMPSGLPGRVPFHYGWVIVGVGVLVSMCCLGMARFAFGMLVPSMRGGLGLDYGQMGGIGTANFLGYLTGASSAASLTGRVGPRRAVTGALVLIAVGLLLVSGAEGFWPVLGCFTLTGLGSGLCNVAMVGAVSRWFAKSLRGWASGLVVAGIGLGLMISGVLVPAVNASLGSGQGWRTSWRVMAAIIAGVAVVAAILLRDGPVRLGLAPAGRASPASALPPPVRLAEARRTTIVLGLVYAMYGFSYAIFATFIVSTLVDQRGLPESSAGWIWFVIGALSLLCGFFGMLSDRVGRKLGLAVVFAMHAVAYLVVGLQLPGALVYLAVALFGVAAWSVPGIMGAIAGDYMAPEQAVRALGALTIFFGIGQAAGPALAGIIGARTGSFSSAYLLAALAAIAGVIGSLTMRQPGHGRPETG